MFSRSRPQPGADAAHRGTRIVVVEEDGVLEQRVAELFGEDLPVSRVGHVDDAIKTARQPTVVIVGPSGSAEDTLERIDSLREVDAGMTTVLMVVSRMSTTLLRRAMRAGVSDVLPESCTDHELADVIRSALDRVEHLGSAAEPSGRGTVVAVFSPKGGTGVTTVALNLAAAAAAAAPAGSPTPILVDADMPFGDVAIGLGLDPTHSLADATGADLDETRLRTLLINAPSAGVRTLLAPPDPARAEVVSSADVSRTLEACRQLAPLVVVDTSSSFDEVTLSILEAADHVVLVSSTDVASVKNAKVAVDTLRRLDIAQSRVHLVLNRVPARPLLPVGDVERVLGSTALCVPEDEAVAQAAHEGKALVRANPRSKAGRALTRLAVQFEELVPTTR